MQKPPPVYSVDLVFHPQRDAAYAHLEHAAANPFQPDPAAFPRVNAWWLADCALLSYWAEEQARPIFQAAGLQSRFISEGSTDCYIAWSNQFVIVAFRGTQPEQWQDTLTDLKILLVPWLAGRVHSGFKEALDDVWPQLEPAIDALAPGRTVWFCGHSLGAALATLAAYQYPNARGVCAFGCPRVGDEAFAVAFNARFGASALRYVNHFDVVTHVPLPPLYAHVEVPRFIAADGTVSDRAPSLLENFSAVSKLESLREMVNGMKGAAPASRNPTLDHMPKAYAIWTWNDYDAKG
jgi:triacylglycerol lipase